MSEIKQRGRQYLRLEHSEHTDYTKALRMILLSELEVDSVKSAFKHSDDLLEVVF